MQVQQEETYVVTFLFCRKKSRRDKFKADNNSLSTFNRTTAIMTLDRNSDSLHQAFFFPSACPSANFYSSGVPQGTVLGPLMFLLFINDIHENLDSTLRLFGDDALLYIRPRLFKRWIALSTG